MCSPSPKSRHPSEPLGTPVVSHRIILKWFLLKKVMMLWTGDIKNLKDFTNVGEFLDRLSDCQLFKNIVSCSVHWVTRERFVFAEL